MDDRCKAFNFNKLDLKEKAVNNISNNLDTMEWHTNPIIREPQRILSNENFFKKTHLSSGN